MTVPSTGSKELVSKFKVKFIKEAKTISELESHHIIRIIEVFEENGTAYYVMDYLSGGSLSDRIPSEGLPESVALDYIRQICDALSYIHKEKILHLDIKPSNILFRKNDEAVLIDFGISKHYDEDDGGQTSSTPVGVSEGYAPTEQYEREGVSSLISVVQVQDSALFAVFPAVSHQICVKFGGSHRRQDLRPHGNKHCGMHRGWQSAGQPLKAVVASST